MSIFPSLFKDGLSSQLHGGESCFQRFANLNTPHIAVNLELTSRVLKSLGFGQHLPEFSLRSEVSPYAPFLMASHHLWTAYVESFFRVLPYRQALENLTWTARSSPTWAERGDAIWPPDPSWSSPSLRGALCHG
jgi:hypothetical protein